MKPTLRLLVLTLSCFLASCVVTFGRPGSGFTSSDDAPIVFLPELRYEDDKLWVSVAVPDGSRPVEVELEGPGAPARGLTLTSTCSSLPWKAGSDAVDDALARNDACAIPLPRASARAGRYTLSFTREGAKVGEAAFNLVEVPGMGGAKGLIVDPALRAGKAYLRDLDQHLLVWLPLDAGFAQRQLDVYFVHDGTPVVVGSTSAERGRTFTP